MEGREKAQKAYETTSFDILSKACKSHIGREIATRKPDPLKKEAFDSSLAKLLCKIAREAQEEKEPPLPLMAAMLESLVAQTANVIVMMASVPCSTLAGNLTLKEGDEDLLRLELGEHLLMMCRDVLVEHFKESHVALSKTIERKRGA